MDRALAQFESRRVQIGQALYRFAPGKGLTLDERDNLIAVRDAIDGWLGASISPSECKRLAMMLFGNLEKAHASFDPDAFIDGLELAFADLSGPAFATAVQRVIAGKAGEKVSKRFVPTVPELAEITRGIEEEWRLKQYRVDCLLALKEDKPQEVRPTVSKEDLEEFRKRIAASANVPAYASHDPASTRGPSPLKRVTEELAARAAARTVRTEAAE